MVGSGPGREGWSNAGGENDGGRPGRGGISRGPGPAWLGLENDTEGETAAFDAERLPPGVPVPRSWERVGITRGSPEADPVRPTSAGSSGDVGRGEATWGRRLAPHHRETVRRYFGGGDREDGEGGNR